MTDTAKIFPKLRFPEFENDGEWKVVKLGDIAQFFKGKGISKAEVSNTGTTPCIRYGELYTYYKEVVRDIKSYTNIPTDNLVLSKANDVIIPSSGETKEDISTASCIIEDGIALGGDINIIRSSANGIFLSYYLNNAKKNDIAKIAQGISIIHLYNEQLQNLSIAFPPLPEQQKIAEFLTSLDELISAHTKKLEALKAHKKGLMQQLFPANGEKTPKLRFPEFKNDGEWKEVRLGDVTKERNEINKTELALLSIGQDGVYPQSESTKRDVSNKDKTKYKHICPNDIGYNTMRMWQGRSAISYLEGIVSPAYTIVIPQANIVPLFLAIVLKLPETVDEFFKHSQGLVSDTLNCKYKDFVQVQICIPSLPEQQKIASFLTSIDEMIQAQDDKIRKLKTYKNGLMQQVFAKN